MRIVHIADVHLDTAFAGRSEETRNRLRQASRDALARCVSLALAEKVDAVLIAGDLFEGSHISFATERFLLDQLRLLDDAGIQVVYATGNHDPGSVFRDRRPDWPDNVAAVLGEEPTTVTIRGRGGEPAGYVVAAGHGTSRVTEDLSRRLRPLPGTPLPQVALLHTQVAGGGGTPAHHPYAPSRLEHLRAAGFHYWALGHVHLRQELSADPPVHYCGNIQGCGPRETGPKGGLLVELVDPGHPHIEFREFSRVRWERVKVDDIGDAHTLEEIVGAVAAAWERSPRAEPEGGDTQWMVVVELAGPSPLWRKLREPEELETIAEEVAIRLGALGTEIRAAQVHPPAPVEEHAGRLDALGAALRLCREVGAGSERLGLSAKDLAGFDPERDHSLERYLRRLLEGGAEEILSRMLVPGDGPR